MNNNISTIEWSEGTPLSPGSYLVTFRYKYSTHYYTAVNISNWDGELWSNYDSGDDSCKIVAWCKLKNIKPYEVV